MLAVRGRNGQDATIQLLSCFYSRLKALLEGMLLD